MEQHSWEDPLKERLARKVDRFLKVPQGHGRVFRIAWAAVGAVLVVVGLAMMVLPGPALVVIPIGLAMLAGLFAWARKALDVSIDRGVDLERRLARVETKVKLVAAVIAGCLVAGIAAVLAE